MIFLCSFSIHFCRVACAASMPPSFLKNVVFWHEEPGDTSGKMWWLCIEELGDTSDKMWWMCNQYCGSIPDMFKRFFSTPKCPDWLWSPPSLLCNNKCTFPKERSSQHVMLTTHLCQVPRLRTSRTVPPLPPYAFVACTGTLVLYCNIVWCG